MRTALFLLLLLAIAAVPGSLVPQRSSDPNGVVQYFNDNPDLAPVLDAMQFFDVYTSVWFSSIYLLLFVSLIGCVVPRTMHHLQALRAKPPKTPARLSSGSPGSPRAAGAGRRPMPPPPSRPPGRCCAAAGYRVQLFDGGSAAVGVGRARLPARDRQPRLPHRAHRRARRGRHRRRLRLRRPEGRRRGADVRQRRSAPTTRSTPAGSSPTHSLAPYRLALNKFTAVYEEENLDAYGQAIDYRGRCHRLPAAAAGAGRRRSRSTSRCRSAARTSTCSATATRRRITVRDGDGNVAFTDSVPVPAAGHQPHLDRRHQGAGCAAEADRDDRLLLPHRQGTEHRRVHLHPSRPPRPDAEPARVHRRPRARQRGAEVRVRVRHRRTHRGRRLPAPIPPPSS